MTTDIVEGLLLLLAAVLIYVGGSLNKHINEILELYKEKLRKEIE